MAEEDDEFEPLFEYSTRQAPPLIEDSDDDDDQAEHKLQTKKIPEKKPETVAAAPRALDDESWLLPPPKVTKAVPRTDPTRLQLRMKQEQLLQSTKVSWDELEKQASAHVASSDTDNAEESKTPTKNPDGKQRERILIKVQDKHGSIQSFRLGVGDRFERLFKVYAATLKLPPSKLVFRFDGEKVAADQTPRSLDLENEDILEVFDTGK